MRGEISKFIMTGEGFQALVFLILALEINQGEQIKIYLEVNFLLSTFLLNC